MNFLRLRSNSEISDRGVQYSPFSEYTDDPLRSRDVSLFQLNHQLPVGLSGLYQSFPNPSDSSDFSPKSTEGSTKRSQFSPDTSSDQADAEQAEINSILAPEFLSDEEFTHISTNRPWENIPIEDLNHVPSHMHTIQPYQREELHIGPFRRILRFYIAKAIQSIPHHSPIYKDIAVSLQEDSTDQQLLQHAQSLGMLPLAIRLHLEFTSQIEIPLEHISFLLFRRERYRRRDPRVVKAVEPVIRATYYPGIELKLGKERDTIIRPTLTSIFREHRESFKQALADVGLKYGELRMWKDVQLCTAIHVADAFRPGIWNRAVDLHAKKSNKKIHGISRRKRAKGLAPTDPYHSILNQPHSRQ